MSRPGAPVAWKTTAAYPLSLSMQVDQEVVTDWISATVVASRSSLLGSCEQSRSPMEPITAAMQLVTPLESATELHLAGSSLELRVVVREELGDVVVREELVVGLELDVVVDARVVVGVDGVVWVLELECVLVDSVRLDVPVVVADVVPGSAVAELDRVVRTTMVPITRIAATAAAISRIRFRPELSTGGRPWVPDVGGFTPGPPGRY